MIFDSRKNKSKLEWKVHYIHIEEKCAQIYMPSVLNLPTMNISIWSFLYAFFSFIAQIFYISTYSRFLSCIFFIPLQGLDLKCLNPWEHPFMEIQDKNEAALRDEILDVLKQVLEVHPLPLAQI
ncbi:unnamed protein product [Camellia sinensis]